jgi:hypothetical protein
MTGGGLEIPLGCPSLFGFFCSIHVDVSTRLIDAVSVVDCIVSNLSSLFNGLQKGNSFYDSYDKQNSSHVR